jgi:hypothetical protein
MDLALYLRVLWRFRLLVLGGFVLAFLLAFLAMFRVSPLGSPKIAYREHQVFQADTTLLVTQAGFPEGRTVLPTNPTAPAGKQGIQYADPGRLASLAVVYAQIANGDVVQQRLASTPSVRSILSSKTSSMQAAPPQTDPSSGGVLPLVDIQGLADTPHDAALISTTGAAVLGRYIANEQRTANIPTNQRVSLSVLRLPARNKIQVVVKRKKTLPIVIFLTVLVAAIFAAFFLENLRPRIEPVEVDENLDVASMRRIA